MIFATYRSASLVSSDEGPYLGWPKSDQQIGIFKAIRMKAGAYNYGPNGLPETNLGRGIACPLCTGVYLAFFFVLLSQKPTRVTDLVLLWLGVSGVQVFLENLTSDDAIKDAIEEVAESLEE